MKVIIAGSRTITDYEKLLEAVHDSGFTVSSVISGMATGADALGVIYANKNDIPLLEHPANWAKYGKSAGPIRNNQMAQAADALIALWDGKSPGTKHMISTAEKVGLKVFVKFLHNPL